MLFSDALHTFKDQNQDQDSNQENWPWTIRIQIKITISFSHFFFHLLLGNQFNKTESYQFTRIQLRCFILVEYFDFFYRNMMSFSAWHPLLCHYPFIPVNDNILETISTKCILMYCAWKSLRKPNGIAPKFIVNYSQ